MYLPAASTQFRGDALPAAEAADAPLDVGVIGTAAGFAALEADWNDLFRRSANPQQVFQDHGFLSEWARHYLGPGDALRVVTGRRNGRLVMAWPLLLRRRLGVATLGFMGTPVAQFGDVLVDREEVIPALLATGWSAVEGLGADLFEARKVRADSLLALSPAFPSGIVLERLEAPFADLGTRVAPDGPGPAYSARERSNYRRRMRRLKERGAITLSAVGPGPLANALAAEAITLKRAWVVANGIPAPAVVDPRFASFFAGVATRTDGPATLQVSLIECDGRNVGIDLSFDCKGTTFGHVIAGALCFEREGIGSVLVHHVLANARARGNTRFDLLAPADPYKLGHADGSVAVCDLAFPFTRLGRLAGAVALKRLRPAAKALARRLPAAVSRALARHR